MQNPFFKLSALAGVISAGAMVVVEAQKHLAVPRGESPQEFSQLADAGEAPAAATDPRPQSTAAAASAESAIQVRGPQASESSPAAGTNPFAFLYGGQSAAADIAAVESPLPVEPVDVTEAPAPTATPSLLSIASEPAPIQLAVAEQEVPEQSEPAPLQKLTAAAGAPVLLAPPTPPRPETTEPEPLQLTAAGTQTAEFESPAGAADVLVLPAAAESPIGVEPTELAQSVPASDRSRSRDRAPAAAAPQQSEPLDLFGPLPTNEPATAAPTPDPAAETLVLPPTTPAAAPVNDDPFAGPAPIPGTGPDVFPPTPDAAATSTPRARTPAAPTAAPAAAPQPTDAADPFPGLFLPQGDAPAAQPQPDPTPAFPAFPQDPSAAAPAADSPVPVRSRGERSPPTSSTPQESPFFTPDPTAAAPQPRPTSAANAALDPFPVLPTEPTPSFAPLPTAAPTFTPEPTRTSIPAAPAATSVPSFPSANQLDPFPTLTTPTPAAPASSIPFPAATQPTYSTTPAVTTPAPATPSFPQPGDLTGTGTFDMTAPAGAQPELLIEKDAPPKAVLNQPLVYNIRVRNVGRTAAHQVIVEDSIPRGSTLKGTIPEAELDPADKHLIWRIGTLAPGEDRLIRVQIVPTEPGEIGSVATVRFVGRIAAKTVITAPRIKLEMNGPVETAVGDVPVYRFRVSNLGDGDAANVLVKSTLPALFQHPSGSDLEYEIGALRPGQTRDFELALSAVRAGQAAQAISVLSDGKEHDRVTGDVVVLASRLSIERTGPERRFVNRPANYSTQVTNQSNDVLRNVTVVETLPAGMELAAVPEHGRYDPTRRTITWVIPQLGPQETKGLHSTLATADPGSYATTVQVWDAAGNKAETSSQLQVAGFSSLKVDTAQMTQGGGEVAVGEQVALRMTVSNRGSAAANEVVAEFEIPPELEFVAARPQQYTLQDRKIRFEAMPHMDVNAQQVIDIVCVARQPGTPRIAASIWSKEQNPIRQEEAVVVFREEP